MDFQRHVDVLQNNKDIIVQNLVLTTDLMELCKDRKVLTVTMLREIQAHDTRENQNQELVESLARMAPDAFHQFCNILHHTGHRLLADHLREEEMLLHEDSDTRKNFADIFKRFPVIEKNLSPIDQKSLLQYVRDKVTENSIKLVWKKHTAARTRAAQERQELLDESVSLERKLNDKLQEVANLNEDLRLKDVEIAEKDQQLKSLSKEAYENSKRHREQVDKISAAQDGAERSAQYTADRITTFDQIIKSLNVRCAIFFGSSSAQAKYDASNVQVSRLEENVQKIIDKSLEYEKTITDHERAIKRLTKENNKLIQLNKDNKEAIDNVQAVKDAYNKMATKRLTEKWDIYTNVELVAALLNIPQDDAIISKGGLTNLDNLSEEERMTLLRENIIDNALIKKRLNKIFQAIERLHKEYDVKNNLLSASEAENDALKVKMEFLEKRKSPLPKQKPALPPVALGLRISSSTPQLAEDHPGVVIAAVEQAQHVPVPAFGDVTTESTVFTPHGKVPPIGSQAAGESPRPQVHVETLAPPIPAPRGRSNLSVSGSQGQVDDARTVTDSLAKRTTNTGGGDTLAKPSVTFREVTLMNEHK